MANADLLVTIACRDAGTPALQEVNGIWAQLNVPSDRFPGRWATAPPCPCPAIP